MEKQCSISKTRLLIAIIATLFGTGFIKLG